MDLLCLLASIIKKSGEEIYWDYSSLNAEILLSMYFGFMDSAKIGIDALWLRA